MSVANRLKELGIELPKAAAPAANYIPFRISGNTLFISGQLPFVDGKLPMTGHVGKDVTQEQAYDLARQCGVNIISVMSMALDGDLDRVSAVLKLGGFVSCTPDFTMQPAVINGCSDLMVEVFGKDVGAHARSAVATPSLPLGTPVEIDAIVEIK